MLLNRLYSNSNALPPDTNTRSKSIYVDRFIELVNHSFKQDHSIRSYADQLCITPNYLNEIVKNATGINAKQYILNKILIESKRLLTYTDLPISAITEALGYEDPSSFHPSISFPNKHDPAKLSQEYKTVKSTISSFIRIIRTPFGMSNFASINK